MAKEKSIRPVAALFYATVRRGVQAKLRFQGKTTAQIKDIMSHLDDDLIDTTAAEYKVEVPDIGGFLKWLLDNQQSIVQIIETIVQIISMFG